MAAINVIIIIIIIFDPGTQFPKNEKNHAIAIQTSTKIKLE